uniref:cytochrome c oxidase subunit II n=1 Tax=Marcia hiantina TaxID=676960 RepID=UPI002237EEF5|nr:cytochrome c oxidase subunit II [Marcia hiantina]UYR95086.1 cytochrome c oxidase subunit II [Marcia hiantina]
MMMWNQFGFPDPVTLNAGRLFSYHDLVMVVVVFVLIVVAWFTTMSMFSFVVMKGQLNLIKKKDEWLEVFWTVSPAFFLFAIGFVSLINLYNMNLGGEPVFSFSAVGHQWYWEYVYELGTASKYEEMNSSIEGSILSISDEWMKFRTNYQNVSPESPEEMVLALQNEYGCEFNGLKILNKLEKIIEESKKELVKNLTHAYKSLNSVSGDYTKAYAASMANSFAKEAEFFVSKVISEAMEDDLLSTNYALWDSNSKVSSKVNIDSLWYETHKNFFTNILTSVLLSNGVRLRFDSYMVMEDDLSDLEKSTFGGFRRGLVTNPCFLCCGVKNEVLVSTVDVMHSWGVQELGIKVDAVPGRINSGTVFPKVPGFFYGFCYELCGTGHSEMPITAVVLDMKNYIETLELMLMKQMNLSTNYENTGSSVAMKFY